MSGQVISERFQLKKRPERRTLGLKGGKLHNRSIISKPHINLTLNTAKTILRHFSRESTDYGEIQTAQRLLKNLTIHYISLFSPALINYPPPRGDGFNEAGFSRSRTRSKRQGEEDMRSSWWLAVGSWLAAWVAFGCVYRLGYLRGEIAGMETAGACVPRARCTGTCGHAGRVTLPTAGVNGER